MAGTDNLVRRSHGCIGLSSGCAVKRNMEMLGEFNGRRACNEVNGQHVIPTTVQYLSHHTVAHYLREVPNPSAVPRKHRLHVDSDANLASPRLVLQGRDGTLLRILAVVDSEKLG